MDGPRGAHHCPGIGRVKEAAAEDKASFAKSHHFSEHQQEEGFEEER